MKGPSLQKTTALSAALHLTVFALAALILRQSQTIIIPSPYMVSLEAPASSSQEHKTETAADREPPGTRVTEQKKQQEKTVKDTKTEQKHVTDQQRIEDRLTEMTAKKKTERIARLRAIVSIRGNEVKGARNSAGQSGPSHGTLFDSYYAKVTNQIRQEWVYPDTGERDMEAVIAVKIAKDGSVTVQGVEKSSGNTLFDRSALRAITKASPVLPPPYEMEIGMRFYP